MAKKYIKIELTDKLRDAVDFAVSECKSKSENPGTIEPKWIKQNCLNAPWALKLTREEFRSLMCILWIWGSTHKFNGYAMYEFARQLSFQ